MNKDSLEDTKQEFLDDPNVDYLEGLEDSDLDFLGASWDEAEEGQPAQHDGGITTVIPHLPADADKKQSPAHGQASSLADASVSDWFFTFMCMNIPIAGWFYLFHLAFRSPKADRQNFARAFLFYKLVFLAISAVILGILIWIGLDMLDKVLAYMEML